MDSGEIKSRYVILHLEVLHGSDRYEINLHMEREPLVYDLQEELEKKARVTVANQKLNFRGQRLHQSPDKPLSAFGLFNGNRIMLIGEKEAIAPQYCHNLLADLYAKVQRCGQDLNTFNQVANNVNVDSSECDALKKKNQTLERIKDLIDISNNVSSAIANYGAQYQHRKQ
ncbi:unnamed protein product [Didymodactylos carnosus]|uniref:Ubiquitin-like domain-containing protein n=1 Tax=Didymodactylos carnosus TaxID=1234261 RepID=A0A814I9P6_9BILA|nr:unnamed protein product [Didymodactylos carnosus]CAF1022552.1 unnamed protein product [Didymodactylos carnosus]CAF3776528.1 unnamed protein product [Didymodactylos carnosus]CAF3793895.1 unnamed protein product [Didymodactylos carnosus]